MIVISPWSRGGYVDSEVFDHTSVIRFIEDVTGVKDANISNWRRATCGDLTSAFNFMSPDYSYPSLTVTAPVSCSSGSYPSVPSSQSMPVQESGTKPARTLPYQLGTSSYTDCSTGRFWITMTNAGTESANMSIYPNAYRTDGPWMYDVGPGGSVSDYFSVATYGSGYYDLTCYGPNGFRRRFAGQINTNCNDIEASSTINAANGTLTITMRNSTSAAVTFTVKNNYGASGPWTYNVPAGGTVTDTWSSNQNGWYDLTATVSGDSTFLRQFAGHIETVPSAPSGLAATVGNAQISLSWTGSTSATSYNVYRGTSAGGESTTPIATGVTSTSYTDTGLTNETTYYYKVAAVNEAGISSMSGEVSATPAGSGPPNGTYKIVCQLSGLALDDPNAGGSGTGVDQQAYNGTNQQWMLTSVGNGNYEITSAANGLALSGPTAGAQLVLQSYTGATNQLWSFKAAGSYYNIVNAATGQVVDDFGQSTASGNPIGQWTANGGTNQNWSLVSIPTGLANGIYQLTPQCATGSRLDANASGTTNGTKVQIWTSNGGSNQKWTFTNMGSGWYKIQPSYSTTLSLEVNGAGEANGSTVDVWADVGQTNERWSVNAVTGGYELMPENAPGESLNVSGNGTANGTNVQIWQWLNQSGAIWTIQ
jgi:hypothetical protein